MARESDTDLVAFLRRKDFVLKEELGRGACGQTVLLYDGIIDEHFVCKKYAPLQDELRESLFSNFIREIKLLHLLHHRNVVRLFNYYLYPERFSGYILMEHIKGPDIEDYLKAKPEDINDIFVQVIDGFAHLETNKILHRDIRPKNILVTNDGVVKIIDFGFGKRALAPEDFGKSITLNWWCELPVEFADAIYDYRTEVYFVGKLFQKILLENDIEEFKYTALLTKMCYLKPANRLASFSEVRKELLVDRFPDIDFDDQELAAYRDFSYHLLSAVSKIEQSTKYNDDVSDIQTKLESCFKRVMLEEYVLNCSNVLRCFINGQYFYHTKYQFPVSTLKGFLDLLRSSSREKKNIILSNLQSKLDAASRYDSKPNPFDDDIPF
jgi:serine/threonine protein kinase